MLPHNLSPYALCCLIGFIAMMIIWRVCLQWGGLGEVDPDFMDYMEKQLQLDAPSRDIYVLGLRRPMLMYSCISA